MVQESFRTKIDAWLVVVTALAYCTPLVVLATMPRALVLQTLPLALAALLLSALFIIVTAMTTTYRFEEKRLFVRSGFMSWRVPYAEIRAVRKTRNPVSSPAFSLDRLKIEYGRWGVMISPKDRTGFLRALRARRPDLVLPP